MENNEINFRQHGKNFIQYMRFIESVKRGDEYLIIGPEYVVMSQKYFKEITVKVEKAEVVIDESEALRNDYPDWEKLQDKECPVCGQKLLEAAGYYCPDLLFCRFSISYKKFNELTWESEN